MSPVNDTQKGQILSLIGIVVSAAIALSSTTFVGNAMAGLMLGVVKGFRVGDFVSVGDSFGRVTERGLFHVEIQTEQRDLITLPNLHLVTNPVKVVRTSGTIVWAEVSLGYDVPRTQIKEVLLKAAEKCELQEPFAHVVDLGDFSVTYRISGLLLEVKNLISSRSKIRECVLDELHAAGIEIVSPTFMNTRAQQPGTKCIPRRTRPTDEPSSATAPESVVFDKAEEAESVEQLRSRFEKLGDEIKTLEKSLKEAVDEDEKTRITNRIEGLKKSREVLGQRLGDSQQRIEDED